MIETKQEMKFFIIADRIMNGRSPHRNLISALFELFFPDNIAKYLSALRHCEYYENRGGGATYKD